jgi:hypothetical protein
MGKYEVDLPELLYYLAPVLLHIVLSLAALRLNLKLRKSIFFISTVMAIVGIVVVSLFVRLGVNHVERFAESLIAAAVLACFNLCVTLLGAYKMK